jgi:hypothetical protein
VKPLNGMESLSQAIERLTKAGYKESFGARPNGQLQDGSHRTYDAHDFVVDEVVRFEGVTDLDEESAVYALTHTSSKLKGTLVVVFGPQIPTEELEVVEKLR